MVIQITNLDKCIKKFGNIDGIDLIPELTEATRKVQRTAKDLAPVYPSPKVKGKIDKKHIGGQLRNSIHTRIDKKQQVGYVYTNVGYAIYQEFGTRYQSGTPFMIPAMNINRAGINSSMQKYIKEQLALRSK